MTTASDLMNQQFQGNNIISFITICSSTTRPTNPIKGLHIYETDTNKTYKNAGTPSSPVWEEIPSLSKRFDYAVAPSYDLNSGFWSSVNYHQVGSIEVPVGKRHHVNLVQGTNNDDGILAAYTFYLTAGPDTTQDCVRGVYGNVVNQGAAAAKAVHAYSEAAEGSTGILMAFAGGVVPVDTTSASYCYQASFGGHATGAFWITAIDDSVDSIDYGIIVKNGTKINTAFLQYDAVTSADFLKLRDVNGTELFSVDNQGNIQLAYQRSAVFDNLTRTYTLQAVQTGDFFRIIASGLGDAFKLYGDGGLALYNATGNSKGAGTINTKGYYTDGVKVVGTQQTAIANNADATHTTYRDSINAILAALRAHGLIAT